MTNRNEEKREATMTTTYNQTKLAEARQAFPNLEDHRRKYPEGRLAEGNGKYMFVFFCSDDATLFYSIGEEQDCLWGANQEITYLEPPRPLSTPTQPSFTEEELLAKVPKLWDCPVMSYNGLDHHVIALGEKYFIYPIDGVTNNELKFVFKSSLTPPKPTPTRLDLLIKWWGEQERPSEIEFAQKTNIGMINALSLPSESDTHYRRGTSEWISLEGVV